MISLGTIHVSNHDKTVLAWVSTESESSFSVEPSNRERGDLLSEQRSTGLPKRVGPSALLSKEGDSRCPTFFFVRGLSVPPKGDHLALAQASQSLPTPVLSYIPKAADGLGSRPYFLNCHTAFLPNTTSEKDTLTLNERESDPK